MSESQTDRPSPATRVERNKLAGRWATRSLIDAQERDPRATQADWAERCGVSQTRISKQLSGDSPLQIQTVLAARPDVGVRFVRQLAAHLGKVLADEPGPSDCLNDYRAFASLGSHSGEVLRVVGAALDDGHVDVTEASEIVEALTALIETACSMRARAAEIVGERGAPVRGYPRAVES